MIPLSVTIITKNEEKNIARTIGAVHGWANEVIVVDSGSTDGTIEIAKALGAEVIHHDWLGYGQQKNFAHKKTKNEWVLNLDADEVLTPELKEEIELAIQKKSAMNGYYISRKSYYLGRWIRFDGWYQSRVVRLSRKQSSQWSEPSVHEQLLVNGDLGILKNPLDHYTFTSIENHVSTNIKYAKQGAVQLIAANRFIGVLPLVLKPFWKFIMTYFIQLGFLDGVRGFIISINAAHSMFLKYSFALEEKKLKRQQ